ncbi:MAG: bifunctional metallophosphatase/5'-nucleotidase [Methylomonas sp.]|nr:bifunctional metallophosphatase/5'-nucleotidase [Methylomonas sp.]
MTACSLPTHPVPDSVKIKIVAFNDFHGHLESPGSLGQSPVGGIEWLAGYVSHLKRQNPNTLVVSAGDLIGASPLLSAMFHDEGTIEAMNRLGLDFNAVGNHEFDAGQDELKRMQTGGCHAVYKSHSCRGADVGTPVPFEGAGFQFLAANVIEESSGRTLFPAYAVKTVDGVRIGFIGMTLKDTPTVAAGAGLAGLTFQDEATTANALVAELRAQGVETIVLLIHQGGTVPDSISPENINQCNDNLEGSPISAIVKQLDAAIDLVISGHTHQAYICEIANRSGRSIPVTSAHSRGRLLTDIELQISRSTGDATGISASNLVVDRNSPVIVPNEALKTLVTHYKAIATPLANRIVGTIAASISTVENEAGESALGDLTADARLAATAGDAFGPAAIAFINPGAIRADLIYESGPDGEGEGNVTYAEAFTMHPFADRLVTLTLTGAQIHTLLEQQFQGCTEAYPKDAPMAGQEVNRILQVSDGFGYTWREKGTPCDNVDPADITINGVRMAPDASYRVTVNDFLANGGDRFYILQQGWNRSEGPTDLEALEHYLQSHPRLKPGPRGRIKLKH